MQTSIYRQLFSDIPHFSKRDVHYVTENPSLRPFYKYTPNLDSFSDVIIDKSKESIPRQLLVDVLMEQYSHFDLNQKVKENIDALLNVNTFTIITAHQPSLFTGPLYYIYKIITTINLVKSLNEKYPKYKFVPVFISGAEDHDFEEINHFHIFGQTIEWSNNEDGATGMMKTDGLLDILQQLEDLIGDNANAQHLFKLIQKTHTKNKLYGMASLELTHELFKHLGLIVLNMNHKDLKRNFIPYIKDEILNQVSAPLISSEIEKIKKAGYKAQAPPRPINFFYMIDQIRSMITLEDNIYKVKNSEIQFSKDEIIQEIENHPERFSPNVIMRPIFQESILPNLGYVGGGGELAYWMERQPQFEHFGLNFPMLIRRNSALWVNKTMKKKMDKLGLTITETFQINDIFIKEFIKKNSKNEVSVDQELKEIQNIIQKLANKAEKIDPTLKPFVLGNSKSIEKTLEKIGSRMMKAEKTKMDVQIKQIENINEKLYPKNGLQERYDNFIDYYMRYGDSYFEVLQNSFEPLIQEMIIITEQ